MIPLDTKPLVLRAVRGGDYSLSFSRPINVPVSVEDEMVVLEVDELRLVATGETVDEAKAALAEQIIWVWETYGRRPDDELRVEAQEFKQKVRLMLIEGDVT